MEDKTIKKFWKYCYSSVRQINEFLNNAKCAMEQGEANAARWYVMEAGGLMNRMETGYSPSGSVYIYKLNDAIQFDVYTAHGDRYEFRFSYGDNTPWNRKAYNNRREWQEFAQQLEKQLLEEKALFERMAKNREMHREIAYYLSYLNDDGLFKAYEAIKELAAIYY